MAVLGKRTMGKILPVEPVIFILCGLFHLHRVWGLADRTGYAAFWLSVLEKRDVRYVLLFLFLAGLCCAGVGVFVKLREERARWRVIYLLAAAYLLFDLGAILVRWPVWMRLLYWMFDTSGAQWVPLWAGFILLGGVSLWWGLQLAAGCRQYRSHMARRLSRGHVYGLQAARLEREKQEP